MTFRIGKTSIRNFGPFEEAEFDFSCPGLTVVEGSISGASGCDSNGSGKSFVLEAPVWALTGRLIRDGVAVDDVVRGYGEGCEVTTTLVGDDTTVCVTRYRKHAIGRNDVVLKVDGDDVSRGTNQATDRAIEKIMGLDFTTFMSTVAFGARREALTFFAATDTERKAVMERLLGLEVYAQAQALARRELREVTEELSAKESGAAWYRAVLQEKLSAKESAAHDDYDDVDILHAAVRVKLLRVAHERQKAVEDQARADRAAEERQYRTQASEVANLLREIDRQARDLTRAREVANRRAGSANSLIDRAKKKIEELRDLVGAPCPTCGQSLGEDAAQSAIQELAREVTAATTEDEEASAEIVDLSRQLAEIHDAAPDPPSRWAIDTVDEELRWETERTQELARRLAKQESRYKVMRESWSLRKRRAKEEEDSIRTLEETVASIDATVVELSERSDRLSFWVDGFGNGGLKSFLIESELAEINRIATGYARRLLGGGARIRIKPTQELKTKEKREKMVVEATLPGRAQNYAGASKGQRHRFDLSLLLAFREVVGRRSGATFDQLFCDELFDGVDQTGVDCVIEILRELSADRPVVLVTHDHRLKSAGDRTVLVAHDGTSATIKG